MKHTSSTVVYHTIDLDPDEQFEEQGWRKTALRIDRITVNERDGEVSNVRLHGYPVLKSGALGQVRSDLSGRLNGPATAVLAAAGLPVRGA